MTPSSVTLFITMTLPIAVSPSLAAASCYWPLGLPALRRPGPVGVPAQLQDACATGYGHQHTAGHSGDEQGHAERDGSFKSQEPDHDLVLVLEDKDDQQDQQHQGGHNTGPDDSGARDVAVGAAAGTRCWGVARGRCSRLTR